MGRALPARREGGSPPSRTVPFVGDEVALADGLRAGNPSAMAALCDRYAEHVMRVLVRIMGSDPELEDLHHDVLVRAIRSVEGIEQASSLKGWMSIIAVNVARTTLKRRALRRWLLLRPWHELPEPEAPARFELRW